MSVKVESEVARPGDESYVDAAWQLKERIRRDEGVLKQRRGFFVDAYRRSTVHLLLTTDTGNSTDRSDTPKAENGGPDTEFADTMSSDTELMGFAAVRRDGYILFLATSPDFRGEGVGKRLVGRVAEDNETVSCHARASNENALGFYEHLGFEVKRHIENYYEDSGDAYYLKLGDGGGLAKKLSDFMRG
ncbi:GNAT family N-acetyltransferase [Halorussus halophilus]|uniref:GNAT family N-acetyltransferase n=1 Tax=Halorussus halophilus TaxID=2650975 RepID=UPI001300CEE5|nr:N-acetyltransferase [Halorussus halophilus]